MGSTIVAGKSGLLTPSIGAFPGASIGVIGKPGAGGSSEIVVVTVGDGTAFNQYGWNTAVPFGSRAPTTFNGQNIEHLIYNFNVAPPRWQVRLTGELAQNFFDTLTFEAAPGSPTFNSANADTFSVASGASTWQWEDNTNEWDGTDVGNGRNVTMTFL